MGMELGLHQRQGIGVLGVQKLGMDEQEMELEGVWPAVSWIGWRWRAQVVEGWELVVVELGGGAVELEGVGSGVGNCGRQCGAWEVEQETHGGGLERRPLVAGS